MCQTAGLGGCAHAAVCPHARAYSEHRVRRISQHHVRHVLAACDPGSVLLEGLCCHHNAQGSRYCYCCQLHRAQQLPALFDILPVNVRYPTAACPQPQQQQAPQSESAPPPAVGSSVCPPLLPNRRGGGTRWQSAPPTTNVTWIGTANGPGDCLEAEEGLHQ